MQKEKLRKNANLVGVALLGDPHIEEITKNNNVGAEPRVRPNSRGITLIALVITIIIMLILVAVSVTVALNGGLFRTAEQAADETAVEKDKEYDLSKGEITIGGKDYTSYEDYLNNNPIPERWKIIETPSTWTKTDGTINDNVIAIEETSTNKKVPLPQGFKVLTVDGKNSISEGLVITDGINEFVWIEYTSDAKYEEGNFGPSTGTVDPSNYPVDSQENLNYWYGTKEDSTEPYYNYSDFTYEADKVKIEESVNKYGGFYVGRYETTIDNGTIGVQIGKTVLTAETLLRTGANTASNDEYHYRWWGLYKAQKDMYGNNEAVFSSTITSKQWDLIMDFTGYGDATRGKDTYTTTPDLSGAAYYRDNTKYDVSKNIYDLAGNVKELTMNAYEYGRINCGGAYYGYIMDASANHGGPASQRSGEWSSSVSDYLGSRTTLYIK